MRAPTALLLAWRALQSRPRRTVILLLGYGLGVAVMIALLAVGDALLLQAQDRDVVSGGDLVLVPAGVDPEVLKVGAITGMFLSVPNARFLVRQVLMGPRYAETVAAVSPEVVDKLVYVRTESGIHAARASAALPSAANRTSSALAVRDPAWTDTAEDRDWLAPAPADVLVSIDRFHRPPRGPEGRTWAEWWYFNFTTPKGLYGYISFIADRDRRAQVAVTLGRPGGRAVRREARYANAILPFDGRAFRAGPHRVDLRPDGYHVRLDWAGFSGDVRIRPEPGLYFPPVEWQAGAFRSGYVAPALRATVTGTLRLGSESVRVDGVGYHDHNWGIWQAVTWEWGVASTSRFALLAGLIRHPALPADELLVTLHAVADGRAGLWGTLRAPAPVASDWQAGPRVNGSSLRVPGRLRYRAANDAGDRLDVEIITEDVIATPIASMAAERGEATRLPAGREVFLQIRGRYTVTGTVGGRPVAFVTQGFAETFVPHSSRQDGR